MINGRIGGSYGGNNWTSNGCYSSSDGSYSPSIIKGELINIPRNWDLGCGSIERVEQIVKIRGLVGVHGHIADNYHGTKLDNGITKSNIERLDKLICHLEDTYPNKIWFTTFADIALYWKRLQSTQPFKGPFSS